MVSRNIISSLIVVTSLSVVLWSVLVEELAKESSINLTPRHWQVIDYIQNEYKHEVPLSIRRVGKSGVVDIREFYELFPKAPLKTATKISGVPKPASCI